MKQQTTLLVAGLLSCNFIFAQWSLTGNAGTVSGVNFLGTTDAVPLTLRVNNRQAAQIDYASGKANTTFGYQALNALTGTNNSAFGYKTLFSNTTGRFNVAAGAYALYFNTTGFSNVALGIGAMYKNTVGRNVIAIGDSALYNQTGANIYSFGNLAIGSKALYTNTDGGSNTALGTFALLSNTTGNYNTAAGYNSLRLNTTGSANTGYGIQTLIFNTTGYNNTASGYNALFNNTTGDNNTAIGYEALKANTTGYYNTSVGSNSLIQSTGANNTAVGQFALDANTTGYGNTAVGSFADVLSGGLQNATAIGFTAYVDASNKVRIGSTAVTSIGGQVAWTNFSDGRVKKNIKANVPGLNFINLLKPVTYNFDMAKEEELMGIKSKENWAGKHDIEKVNFSGFVAQEVEAAAQKINYDFSGIDKTGKVMGLRYSEFVVPLVKAVQELSAKNNELQKQNDDLQTRIAKIESMLAAQNTSLKDDLVTTTATLSQNAPNPFSASTVISYTLPQKYNSAQIIITDNSGKTVKQANAANTNSLSIVGGSLPAGTYKYSLVVDSKRIATKTMVLTK